MMIIEFLKAILFGIVEGITEWLPVSSTGHLILLDEFLSLNVASHLGAEFAKEYWDMFEVVIQLGAILAVVVMFFGKLNPFSPKKSSSEKKGTWTLWAKVCVGSIPAAIIGIVLDKIIEKASGKDIDGWLYNWQVVSIALIVYGVLFIIIERAYKHKKSSVVSVDDISFSQAALIGCFQALAIIPGTSRSGSTILGSRLIGISRPAAAEFSFFMGIPAMAGASLLKTYGFLDYVSEANVSVPFSAYAILLCAALVAFIVSMIAIKFLMEFVKKHSFAPFGVYRIILGALVIGWFLIR
ncbi:MAG: undecaprenyl-diphosphate phosphatase [Ruminococcaceae bacterium]|nr:undecaprenyl-diphosphate phosphatase [Oscillospiraceae bacterium]